MSAVTLESLALQLEQTDPNAAAYLRAVAVEMGMLRIAKVMLESDVCDCDICQMSDEEFAEFKLRRGLH
jgi:hypothetical protein